MSTASSTSGTPRSGGSVAVPRVELWNWPLRKHKFWGLLALGIVLVGGGIGWSVSGSLGMGALSAAVLAVPLRSVWFPVHFHIGARGIQTRCLGRERLIPWHAVQECRFLSRGVLIRFRAQGALFDAERQQYIDGRDQPERLLATVHFYRQHADATVVETA